MLSFFPRDVLGEILDLNETVFEGFPTYSYKQITNVACDESEMRSRQKRIVTFGEPQSVKQYH